MPEFNLGNIVGILASETPPTKKDILWAKILNPSFPDIVDIHYWDESTSNWVPVYDPTTQYWLRPVLSVITTPPGTPQEGDRYLIADAGATGVWSGKEDQVAEYKAGTWQYQLPLDGFIVSVRDQVNTLYDYRGVYLSGGSWTENDFSVPVAPGDYIQSTEKGQSNGVATLDSSGKVPQSQLDHDNFVFNPATPPSWGAINTIKGALDYLRELITSAVEGITASDIDTVAKIEAILTDGNTLTTGSELNSAIVSLIGGATSSNDTLGKIETNLASKLDKSLGAYQLWANPTGSTANAIPIDREDLREFWDMIIKGNNGDAAIILTPGSSIFDLVDGLFRVQHSAFGVDFQLSGGDLSYISDQGTYRKKILVDATLQQIRLEIRNKSTDALIQSIIADANGIRRGVAASGSDGLEVMNRSSILAEFIPWVTSSRADEEIGWEIGPGDNSWTGRFELQLNWLFLSMFQSGVGRLLEVAGTATYAHLKSVHTIAIKDNLDALAPLQIGEPADPTHAATQNYVDTQIAGVAAGSSAVLTPVQDEAALKAIDTTDAGDYPDKIQILVENLGSYRLDRDSAVAEDSPRIIAPTVGVGRWFKFSNTLSDHNLTENKQGGTTNEYYHLTAAQHAIVAGSNTSYTTAKEAFLDQRPLQVSKTFGATDTIDVSTGKIINANPLAQNVLINAISNVNQYGYVYILVSSPAGFKFEFDFSGAIDGLIFGAPRINRAYLIKILFEDATTLRVEYITIRPEVEEVDFTLITTIDGTLAQTIIDTDFAGAVTIDTLSGIEETTYVEIDGGGTVDFSSAIKTDPDNIIWGETDTVNPSITIKPRKVGGYLIIYNNSSDIKEKEWSLSDMTTNTVASTTVRKNAWRPRVDIKIVGIYVTLATPAVGTTLFTVDIHNEGATIFSTPITLDSTEGSNSSAATPHVFLVGDDSVLAGELLEFFVDDVGDSTAGQGAQITIRYIEV